MQERIFYQAEDTALFFSILYLILFASTRYNFNFPANITLPARSKFFRVKAFY